MSCSNGACNAALGASDSLRQGEQFAAMTRAYHGGRSRRRAHSRRAHSRRAHSRRAHSRRAHSRRAHSRRAHSRRAHRMRGGSYATFPGEFSQTLPQDMHAAADITSLDKAFAQLPEFVGKYGMIGGRRSSRRSNSRKSRRSRRNMRRQRGGVAPVDAPGMILSPGEEGQAFLNPQWYNENLVNPNFRGPVVQKAGKRSRKHRKVILHH